MHYILKFTKITLFTKTTLFTTIIKIVKFTTFIKVTKFTKLITFTKTSSNSSPRDYFSFYLKNGTNQVCTRTLFENQQKCGIWFLNLGIFHQFCLIKVGNTIWPKASGFQKLAKLTIFGIFNEVLPTVKVNGARFARNVEWDFFCDFRTLLCTRLGKLCT